MWYLYAGREAVGGVGGLEEIGHDSEPDSQVSRGQVVLGVGGGGRC